MLKTAILAARDLDAYADKPRKSKLNQGGQSGNMAEPSRILGLILAGGLSRRMGGGDKGLLPLRGAPMLAHAIARLARQCAALVLNANGDPTRFAGFGLPVVADDPTEFAGPLAGVLAGLEYCAAHAPELTHVASLAADTPFAPSDLVSRLSKAAAGRAEIAVAASGGRTHHVAALWPVALASDLRRALVIEKVHKVESFMSGYRVAAVEWPVEPIDPFFNVNTPDDLRRAEAFLKSSGGGV